MSFKVNRFRIGGQLGLYRDDLTLEQKEDCRVSEGQRGNTSKESHSSGRVRLGHGGLCNMKRMWFFEFGDRTSDKWCCGTGVSTGSGPTDHPSQWPVSPWPTLFAYISVVVKLHSKHQHQRLCCGPIEGHGPLVKMSCCGRIWGEEDHFTLVRLGTWQ